MKKVKSLDVTDELSCYELALKPSKENAKVFLKRSKWQPRMYSERVSDELLKVLHLLSNQYAITSLASIIQYDLSSNMAASHHQLVTKKSDRKSVV